MFLSILAGGSIDSGIIIKQDSIFVRDVGPRGEPKTKFTDMVDAKTADAKGWWFKKQ